MKITCDREIDALRSHGLNEVAVRLIQLIEMLEEDPEEPDLAIESLRSFAEFFIQERLVAKDRTVPFGVEVMGRVRDLGSEADVLEIARAHSWVQPVIDFAHLHAVTDGGFVESDDFAGALGRADDALDDGVAFHIHFSDIAYANRNETKHLPYGEGTLRAEPLADALLGFDRDATVISESPDAESHAQIRDLLRAAAAKAS